VAKKSLKINQFHGGLNNYRDRRDTPDDALANAANIMVDIPGKIRMMGRDIESKLSYNEDYPSLNTGVIDGLTTPGYGLFAFSADHALDGTNTQNSEFIVYQSQSNFNIVYDNVVYKLDGALPYGDHGISTTGWQGSPRPDFLYGNERLFISDGDFANVSTSDSQAPHVFEYLSNQRFPTTNSNYGADQKEHMNTSAGWYTSKASYPKPNIDDFEVTQAITTSDPTSAGKYEITAQNDNTGVGSWENQWITYGVSILYGDEESRITYSAATDIQLNAGAGALVLGFSLNINTNIDPALDRRITGYKIYVMSYSSDTTPTYLKDPYLLATVDIINETLTSHEGESVDFNAQTVSSATAIVFKNTTSLVIKSLPTSTFEMENLYAHDVDTIRAKWKTSTQIGNALYIGNVRTLDDSGNEVEVNPDKIIRSIAPPGTKRMGIFPSTDFLDVTVGDGDQIIALESFADKLLVFKKKTLFVINVSGDIEYIELERKFVGIENPYNVTKTELGIAWVTVQGAFLYDGEKIVNLIDGKLDPYIEVIDNDTGLTMPGWSTFIGNTGGGQVAYIPTLKQLVVIDSPINPGDEGNFFIFDFKTGSWTYANDRISSKPRSSIISGHAESFLWLGSISAPGNATTSFIANVGVAALDYKALIYNLSNEMVTSGNETYQLMVNGSTPLTSAFTYTGEAAIGEDFASVIATEISSYVDDAASDPGAIQVEALNSATVQITFTGVGTTTPNIFGEELYWDTTSPNVLPKVAVASFFQAGIGHSVAPVRGWYHAPSMANLQNHIWGDYGAGNVNHSDDNGIMQNGLASWGGNTWGGSIPFISDNLINGGPAFYEASVEAGVPNVPAESPKNWYTPFFSGQNMIYPWVLNHLNIFLGRSAVEGKVNAYELNSPWNLVPDAHYSGQGSTHFDNDGWLTGQITLPDDTILQQPYSEIVASNGVNVRIGSPWGYRGFNPVHYNLLATAHDEGQTDTGLHDDDIMSGFDPNQEYEKRNNESDLYSYTGMVIMPGAGDTHMVDSNTWDIENEAHALGGPLEDDIITTPSSVRANPRLIRYMCDFSENTALSEEDNFTLPNATNNGNYVSPGLIYTQAWTSGTDDDYVDTIKGLSPYGNGHYTPDGKGQEDTQYPNGYHFFGFGHGNVDGEIIEAIGGPAPEGGLNYNRFHSTSIDRNDDPLINGNPITGQNGLFAGSYFIGRKIKWKPSKVSENSAGYNSQKSIAEDILEPEKFRLFKNFGDMSHQGDLSWGSNATGAAIDDATEEPSTLLRSGIPFNQQSIIGLGDTRENPVTRDQSYFIDGSPNIISTLITNGTKEGYIRQGQKDNVPANLYNSDWNLESPGAQTPYTGNALHDEEWDQFADYTNNQPICYTSMPYLVIEVEGSVDTIRLHMICNPANNLGHNLGDLYSSFISPGPNERNYSLDDLILTGGSLIDLKDNKKYTFTDDGPDETILRINEKDVPLIQPVDSRSWGLNGYLVLEFSYSAQSLSVKGQIDSSGMSEYGTSAFWFNPLSSDSASDSGSSIANTKDPIALDYGNPDVSAVPSTTSSFTGSYSPFFNLISYGQRGSKDEVILHAKKGHTIDIANNISLSATISKGTKSHSVVNSGLEWDNDSAAGSDSIYQAMSVDGGNSILERLETSVANLYESVANVKRTVNFLSNGPWSDVGTLVIEGSDERGYFRSGDAIWFESLIPTVGDIYLISSVVYDEANDRDLIRNTTITLDSNSNYTHPSSLLGELVYKSNLSSPDLTYIGGSGNFFDGQSKIIYGTGLHFTGEQQFSTSPPLEVSGSFGGELQVLTFNNSSAWVENTSTDVDNEGTFSFETKDFDFGDPSLLKNINYIDISMKSATTCNPIIKYAVNNSNDWLSFSENPPLSNEFKSYRYKLASGSIKNIRSIRIKIYTEIATKSFELNDITIVYRQKIL
tara:strand:+ start:542 stop:6313 length:5772 start_codon:yes stop_codon:yes gene_type:complete